MDVVIVANAKRSAESINAIAYSLVMCLSCIALFITINALVMSLGNCGSSIQDNLHILS